MAKYYNTKETAERALQRRKTAAIKRIEERGDKIVRDDSFVYQDYIWTKYDEKTMSVTRTNILKWHTFLAIVTYDMIMDLLQMTGLKELQEAEEKLLKSLDEEKKLNERL